MKIDAELLPDMAIIYCNLKDSHVQLKRNYDDLLVKYNEALDAIRAYCDETDLEFEGKLSAALRQFVWNDADSEALREMEGR